MPIIAPSLLASDFSRLGEEIKMVNGSEADWFHIDVMDGVFVPNISYGQPVVQAIHKHARKPLDVHLMIVDPDRYIKDFATAGAAVITVHYEACTHLHRTVQLIKENGAKAGVALNPHTPVEVLDDILHDLDLVLVMSVNPGFGGQKFIERSLNKISRMRRMIAERNLNALIEVDGGVGLQNAGAILKAGADVLVAGSSIFNANNPSDTIRQFKELSGAPVFKV